MEAACVYATPPLSPTNPLNPTKMLSFAIPARQATLHNELTTLRIQQREAEVLCAAALFSDDPSVSCASNIIDCTGRIAAMRKAVADKERELAAFVFSSLKEPSVIHPVAAAAAAPRRSARLAASASTRAAKKQEEEQIAAEIDARIADDDKRKKQLNILEMRLQKYLAHQTAYDAVLKEYQEEFYCFSSTFSSNPTSENYKKINYLTKKIKYLSEKLEKVNCLVGSVRDAIAALK
jgi:hypothetical protein